MRYAWPLFQGATGFADGEVLSLIHRWVSAIQMLVMSILDGAIADILSALQFRYDSTVVSFVHKSRLVDPSPMSFPTCYLMNPNIRCVLSETRH